MNWVVDCSFAAALFLPDESSTHVREFFSRLSKNDQLLIPSLWWYELANVLIVCERKNRLHHAEVWKILGLFEKFDLETDYVIGISYSKSLYELAKQYNLSSYDAAYLELVIRKEANLASLDQQLLKVAVNCGITVYH